MISCSTTHPLYARQLSANFCSFMLSETPKQLNITVKTCKNCAYILKLLLNKNLLSGNHNEKLYFCSNLRLIWLTRQIGAIISSKVGHVCHTMKYGSNYLRKHWQTTHFSQKKYGIHDDQTMIMVWIMENMVIILWSWWPCQETWPPCRHPGMVMTMSRHDHGMIMTRSCHGSHVFSTKVA